MKKLLHRTFTILWIGVFLLILGEVVFQLFLLPLFKIRRVVVETDLPLSRLSVLRMSDIDEEDTYFSISPADIEDTLRGFPSVRQAVVAKQFPHTLYINIEARKGIAVIFVQKADTLVPAVVDEQGVLFAINKESDLPVISGFVVEQGHIGQSLPEELTALLSGLHVMREQAPELYASISECRVNREENGEYEVLVYPLAPRLPVRMSLYLEYEAYEDALFAMGIFPEDVLVDEYEEVDVKGTQLILHRRGGRS